MKVIAITGTPGTGKSSLAKRLLKKLKPKGKLKRLDLHGYYKTISAGYDHKKQSYVVDLNKFKALIKDKAKLNEIIIDSHLSHLLPKAKVKLCIVLVCSNLKLLERRLKKRNYSPEKIRENLDAEIFQVCLQEARERKHNLLVIDSAKKYNFSELVDKIRAKLA
ncbi:MAG TPA: AAA family ATPase [Candidatus Nanoarchaeia archaeon]|nr:AAA family ATPase [Candidatus Nanoarchaeia archaeon]